MRKKFRQKNGLFNNIPIISADSIRHGMREAAAYYVLNNTGLIDTRDLNEKALRLLFSGGMITGSGGGSVNLVEYRNIIKLMPHLGLFGCCAQNRIIPGRLVVNDAVLLCKETVEFVPIWLDYLKFGKLETYRSYIEEIVRVRMDPMVDSNKNNLVSCCGYDKLSNMPINFETIIPGSIFWFSVEAIVLDDIEMYMLSKIIKDYSIGTLVGGKSATGCGRVELYYDIYLNDEKIDENKVCDEDILKLHFDNNKQEIKEFLSKVIA
jgi:hypothetical protein